MVQEVQQQGNRYQTPNEIQWIWEIRRRVREHTQVTPSFSYECTANGSVTISLAPYETKELQGTITSISSSYGNTEFRVINGWLRIPLAWAYLAEISGKWGTTSYPYRHILRIWKETIASFQSTSSSTWTTINKTINLGRGNIIDYYGKLSTGEGGMTRTGNITITLKKL